ncbi:MAG: hypothetical protein KDH97_14080 [Calditrichaeota bacterium]|nr:hypothetical protein [Calditrichota bacterium]MCB9088309.1 hypothetical protein [Calditrichia bacterium]MCB0291378.1 hypothetical protein [Calditrichota bacterium]MCB0296765.1 hypothetical protein [Calditrichota bacterium]MCB0305224.1 hypothetical protein [Calditrichota bacterium]
MVTDKRDEHLSEAQLQAYLDKDAALDRKWADKHLGNCPHCRQALSTYKQLYRGLADEAGFMLSANFVNSVTARVEAEKNYRFDHLENGLMVLLGLVALASILVFTDWSSALMEYFRSGSISLVPSFVKDLPLLSEGRWHLVLFALLALSAVGLVDKMLVQMRHR